MNQFTHADLSCRTYERRISARNAAGAAALIHQRSEVRIAHLTVPQPSLIVVTRGEKLVEWEDNRLSAGPGNAILLRGGQFDVTNRPDAGGVYEAHWLTWSAETVARFPEGGGGPRASSFKPNLAMLDAIGQAREALADPTLPDVVVSHRVDEIILWLRYHGISFVRLVDHSLTSRVRTLIAGNPSYEWDLTAVAGHLAVSTSTLRRNLGREGASFSDILIDTRMTHALSLLQCTDTPVNMIALEAGYESPSRFSVRFRKRFGFSPRSVRALPALEFDRIKSAENATAARLSRSCRGGKC